jgi:hypothetical protein
MHIIAMAIDFFDRPLRRDDDINSWEQLDDAERAHCRTTGIVPSDYPGEVAEDWPDLIEIVRRRVKPERDRQNRRARRLRWWQYAEKSTGLYTAIAALDRVLVCSRLSPQHGVTILSTGAVLSEQLVVFTTNAWTNLSLLQSRVHEIWARYFASDMGGSLRYTPSDCFETFPFPFNIEGTSSLETAGRAYHDHRAALMVARNEGMTRTYNRFHDPNETAGDIHIQRLRELHAAMDRAVLEAYGWHDLAVRAEPRFLDETSEDDHTYQGRLFWPSDFRDEVLARLLALNAARHAEEARLGAAPGMRGRMKADDGEDSE